MKSENKVKKKLLYLFLKGITVASAFIFIIEQNANDTCFIWHYEPDRPKVEKKVEIKNL